MVRFLCIDLWSKVRIYPQLNFRLERKESLALCNFRRKNHEVWSLREEGPGHCSISKKLLRVQISVFYNLVESHVY